MPIAATIREARRCVETGESQVLLLNLSGHGHFDMSSYDRYFAGELRDYDYPAEAIKESLAHLPKVRLSRSAAGQSCGCVAGIREEG